MSLILVVEPEASWAEKIRNGLAGDGWKVEIAGDRDSAIAIAGKRGPKLVLVNASLPAARELLTGFSRLKGGPGSIALLPETGGPDAPSLGADAFLRKPFTDQALRESAKRVGGAVSTPKTRSDDKSAVRLTSEQLFGDLLAEVESDGAAAASKTAAAPKGTIEQALADTLTGLGLKDKRAASAPTPAPPAHAPSAADTKGDVEEMLSRTLAGLKVGDLSKRPAAKPAKPETSAPAPAPPAAKPATPSAPVAAKPPAAPVAPRAASPVAPQAPAPRAPVPAPAASTKRPSRELDLAQLDHLAKPKTKESSVEVYATQRIELPRISVGAKPAPTEFGQYTLLERIAVGGMAEVWKARMKGVEGFQKTVAIKRILPQLTDSSDFVTMFIDEAKLAAQLNHQNIIHIYDLGKIGDDFFIAMEFVDGKDLRTILNSARAKSEAIPLGLALLVAARLAAALDHAHKQKDFESRPLGLVHRDVSPQNVLISYDGDIKLCDFGIVKAVTKASKTQMGALKGKLQYMSPEQAWGRPVDSRSDIFSLGSLLFEMLTGRRLFAGESEMSVLDAVREGRIQAPRDLDPRLPLEVNALVLKALARDPEDRFQAAGEMQREIEKILFSLKPTPGQADLASFMRQLFGVDAKAAESAVASRGAVAAAPAASAAKPAVAGAAKSEPAEISAVAPAKGYEYREAEAGGKSRAGLWIGIAAVVAIAVAALVYVARAKTPQVAPVTGAPVESPTAASPEGNAAQRPPSAEATTPKAPSADLTKIVDQTVAQKEAALKQQYEQQIQKSEAELAQLKQAAPATAKPAAAAAPTKPVDAAARAAGSSTNAATAPPPTAAASTTQDNPSPAAPQQNAAPEPVAAPPPTETAPPPPPAVAKSTVKAGDMVEMGAGVTPPVLVSFDKPQYPPIARRMRVEGTVVLSLLVDENGSVVETKVLRAASQNVGLNEAALAAAKSARFRPATKDGVPVKMWSQLTVPFKLNG